jgi:hypothetical protein
MNDPEVTARYLGPDHWNLGAHWLIARCPYCKKRHTHGADVPARDSLGLRHSHCTPGGQYRLQADMTDAATAAAMKAGQ